MTNGSLLNLYHRLPHTLRSLVCTAYGLRMDRRRYGRLTERWVEEALERDHWSAERWSRWQAERLAFVLERAAKEVPYYREQWSRRRQRGDRSPWEKIENWPILDKDELRANPRQFLADDCVEREMFREDTSGSTGTPLQLYWSRETTQRWYALFEARWRRWHGVSRSDRWGHLGSQLIVPPQRRGPPFGVWNAASRQLYLSSYHLAPDSVPDYLDAIKKHEVRYLYGFPSGLSVLATEILRTGRQDVQLHVVVTDAEPVHDFQRQAMESAFQCPVRETYGMTELVAGAGECAAGNLHMWPEAGVIEVIEEDNQPADRGSAGELVCTGLLNADMPLIRYRVGDRAALAPEDSGDCDCGRTLPMFSFIEGRSDDVLLTPDGRRVGRLDSVFKGQVAIREAQIVQESLDRVRIKIVPLPGLTASDKERIAENVESRINGVRVTVEEVSAIPRGARGKPRAVVCLVPHDQRAQAAARG